jgi:stage V sporulation protein D (sporulation-specific penicillin-binding protein)
MEGEGTLVTDQTPAPGARVPAQTTVHLYFAQGELEDVEVPSVVGLSMLDASAKLSAAGLQMRVVGSGVAAEQLPQAGARVPKGSVVEVRFKL